MTIILSCRHEIGDGELVVLRDADGYHLPVTVGRDVIAVADLSSATCDTCGEVVKVVGVR